MPYETRGLYGRDGPDGPERFSADTWVQRDICDREPYPFEDEQFDFVVCSHTLEDVRDPIWVCDEMVRVAKRGLHRGALAARGAELRLPGPLGRAGATTAG